MEEKKDIHAMALRISEEMVRLRRDFHTHPELGFKEKRTSGIIAEYLKGLGMEVRVGVGKTGVVGLLKGKGDGRTVMLRADMDALPVQEKGSAPYSSAHKGIMHACGHDGHMAILLGTAQVLSQLADEFAGQVKFVFQPAEEASGGAQLMIENGVLEDPRVDAAFALHLVNTLPVGFVGWCKGTMMAAMDTFRLLVQGKTGHSAMPEGSIDAIAASARVVLALQGLTTHVASTESCLVNVGTIKGGEAVNVVAGEVELTGTVRTLDRDVRAGFPASMVRAINEAAGDMKATFELDYEQGYPAVVNDPDLTDLLVRVVKNSPWAENLVEIRPVMGSEDMAFYFECVPGSYFFLGAGNTEKSLTEPLHSAIFDFDERALTIGATILSMLAVSFLQKA